MEKALLDLRASVIILSYSIYKQLWLGKLKTTTMTLSLANRFIKVPRGIVEDMLVRVDKFYYLVNFVVLDTEPLSKGVTFVHIILRRPFLVTTNALINCWNRVMQLYFGNMTLKLNVFNLSHQHNDHEKKENEEVCQIESFI